MYFDIFIQSASVHIVLGPQNRVSISAKLKNIWVTVWVTVLVGNQSVSGGCTANIRAKLLSTHFFDILISEFFRCPYIGI